jgi:hypothetical protein
MDASAQQRECFTVVMSNRTSGDALGSILLDRCTGNSWILVRVNLSSGSTAFRWSPLSVEKSEVVVPHSAP